MRERDLARLDERASADQSGLRNRMMRKAKRARAHDAGASAQQSRDAVDLRYLERLVRRHRRKNRGQPSCEHRLAAAGRPDEEQVVAAGRGNFECSFGSELAATERKKKRLLVNG